MKLRRKAFTGKAPFAFSFVISSNRQGFDLRAIAIAAGWNQTDALQATITVNPGVVLYGADTAGSFAFLVSGSYPDGTSLRLINNGTIIGCGGQAGNNSVAGGAGRDAISVSYPVTIDNTNGLIAGGGGGAGGGGSITAGGLTYLGGVGGSGSGLLGVVPGVNGSPGQAGPGGAYGGGQGGKGGYPGRFGQSGSPAYGSGVIYPPTAGGAPGRAIVGGEKIIWESLGTVRGEIVSSVNNFIPTPAATPGFNAPFEGGYYLFSQVQRVVNTNANFTAYPGDSNALIPGEYAVIKVPEMLGKPRFYAGQVLLFGRADSPANRPSATVISATGDVLCIRSAASVFNTGEHFIQANYRLIISPKENEAQIAFSSGMAQVPNGAAFISGGEANTAALDATPGAIASLYCSGLVIAGFDDWYLPARNDLELFVRTKKPVTDSNYVVSNRPVSSISYEAGGDVADTSTSHGVNRTTAGADGFAYTASSPSRTGSPLFQSPSGTQRLESGAASAVYLSSTKFSDTEIWAQKLVTGEIGRQVAVSKDTIGYVRPVRRSII